MATDILTAGDKIDIRVQQQVEQMEKTGEIPRVYKSVLYEIKDNGDLEIAMPTEGGKMALLSLGVRYEMVVYTKGGLYRSVGQVKERYKSDNLFMLRMEVKTSFRKHQRREYYRFPCTVEMQYLLITDEEGKLEHVMDIFIHHKEAYPDEEMKKGLIADVSGGGVRFITEEKLDKNRHMLMKFNLINETTNQEYLLHAQILQVIKLDTDIRKYEYRVQFVLVDAKTREQIIKYIFEEERKMRKR